MHSQPDDDRALQLLWGVADVSTRGPKARFTVREVAAAACRLADDTGLSSLSLARVAAELGLTTTALYRYVDSKETLVDLMTDQAIGSPPAAEHGEAGSADAGIPDWEQSVQHWVRQLSLRYAEHRWLAEVQVSGMPRHPNRLHWLNAILLILDRGGVRDPLHIALLLDSLARAFATLTPVGNEESQRPPDWLAAAISERFPRLASDLGRDWGDTEVELARAIDTVLSRARDDTLGRTDSSPA